MSYNQTTRSGLFPASSQTQLPANHKRQSPDNPEDLKSNKRQRLLPEDPHNPVPHSQHTAPAQFVRRPKTNSIIAADLRQFAQVAQILRGRSQAKLNCTHLARDFLIYLFTGKLPKKASITRPSTAKDFSTVLHHVVSIKKEQPVVFTGYSHITQAHPDYPALRQPDISCTDDGTLEIDPHTERWKIDDYVQPSANYLEINTVLKNLAAQSEWGVSFGLINLGKMLFLDYALVARSANPQPRPKQIEFECSEHYFSYRLMQDGRVISHSLPWDQLPEDMPRESSFLMQHQFYFLPDILIRLQNLGHIKHFQQFDPMQSPVGHQLIYFADAAGGLHYLDLQNFKYQDNKPVSVENYVYPNLAKHYSFNEEWSPIVFYIPFSPKIEQEEDVYIKPDPYEWVLSQ